MLKFNNVAIIGYGRMGRLYDRFLTARYIVDILPVQNRIYFSQLDEFISYGQPIDIAIVTTPTPNHEVSIRKLLSNKINVLCEKPLCFSAVTAASLERLARRYGLILYQSTLERYNPVIKYTRGHIPVSDIDYIESHRFGIKPSWDYTSDPKYDLGIHDVDLWIYLTKRSVPWKLSCGYGVPKREIIIFLKDRSKITLDLQNKSIKFKGSILDFSAAKDSNPIVEMLSDLEKNGVNMNEKWSTEIGIIERMKSTGVTVLQNILF